LPLYSIVTLLAQTSEPSPLVRLASIFEIPMLVEHLGNHALFEERLARERRDDGALFVAQDGGVPVGFGYLWLEEAEEPEIRVHLPGVPLLMGLEIVESHRGKGFGTKLIWAMEKFAIAIGRDRIALGIL